MHRKSLEILTPKFLTRLFEGWEGVPSSLHLSIFSEVFTMSSYYIDNQEKRKQFSFRKNLPLNSGFSATSNEGQLMMAEASLHSNHYQHPNYFGIKVYFS